MKKLLLITTALAVGFAGPAHADPITAAAVWVSSTFAVSAATATLIVNFAVSTALTAISKALYKPKLPGQNVSFDVKMGDDLPLSFVAGDYATAGKRKYMASWGRNTRFITQVIEYSCLPQGLDGIWVNDERGVWANDRRWAILPGFEPASNVSDNIERDTVPDGWLDVGRPLSNLSDDGNRIYVKFVDGTQAAADPFLVWAFGSDEDYPWTSAMVGRGKSYAIITTRYDDDSLTSYPDFLIEPAPLPMYDWRYDSTNGGSGPQRWGNRATYQPTRNPAVIAYNIVRGIYYGDEWVFGGKNLAAWRLPVAEWSAAANACDQDINLSVGGVQPRYRCGMEISVDMEPASVLDEIGKSANMKFAEVGGRLKPIVDLPGAAVFAFTDGDILITEGQSFSPFYPASETFNAISATYPERGEKWASKDAPEYIDADAQEDDGEYLPTSMSYGAVPFGNQVQRLMRSQMRDFRRMRRHQFYLPPDAYALEPGIDMVSWTSDRNGYINKQFMVESVSKTPGMNVLVSLREVNPSDYDWSSDFERPIIITPPVNPRPFVQPIRGLAVLGTSIQDAAGTARRPAILVACDGDERGVTHIQIEARRVGTTQTIIDTERPFAEPHSWYLLNVLPATAYEVRARLISDLTPRSAWSSWLTATTPDVRLGGNDVRYEEIIGEVREDLGGYLEWIDDSGAVYRDVRDQIDAIRDGVAEGDFGQLVARDQIREQIAVEVGSARAEFSQLTDVILTDQMAASIRTTNLESRFLSSVAGVRQDLIAMTGPNSALAADISRVEASIGPAVAEGTSSLTSRVTDIERVAGTNNRVYRQSAEPTSANVINGDYWKDTDTGQWHSRTGGVWVAVAESTIPRIIRDVTAVSESVTDVTAKTNRGTANGLMRVSAESSPAGVQSRIGLRAEASDSDSTNTAALFLEANTDGTSQAIVAADRFAIATGQGPAAARSVPFVVDGSNVYMQNAIVRTLSIGDNQVTIPASQSLSGDLFGPGVNTWIAVNEISYTLPYAGYVNIRWDGAQGYQAPYNNEGMGLRLVVNGVESWARGAFLANDWLSMSWQRSLPAGTHTIRIDWRAELNKINLFSRTLLVQGVMR